MKRLSAILRFLGASLLMLCFCTHARADTRTHNGDTVKISLAQALKKIEADYHVHFAYERALVQDLEVNYPAKGFQDVALAEALRRLLTPHALTFEAINKEYYTIIKVATAEKKTDTTTLHAHSATDTSLAPLITVTTIPGTSLATLRGAVVNRLNGQPVEYAMVGLAGLGLFTMVDSKGHFEIGPIPEGTWPLQVQCANMVPYKKPITLTPGTLTEVTIFMDENVLLLKEVNVVAQEGRTGASTSSTISQTAIEHLQATSLSDVLQLLPGAVATNPDFSGVSQASIRQVSADDVNSLGTALIINGAPVSNNANLQATNTASAGSNASFSTSSGSGVDMRQFTADNVESIEVIRGVPSVEYGDLTSGAIIVKTKSGEYPLHIKARINPTLKQAWVGKGFNLRRPGESLNVDLDYTHTYDDQRYTYIGYNRLTANALYARQFFEDKPLYTKTGFTYGMNLDEQKRDPDNPDEHSRYRAQDLAFRFNTSGKWSIHQRLARTVNYMASVNYTIQKGFQQSLVSGATFPLMTAMKDTTMVSSYADTEYISKLWIDGKPLNIFTKITDSFFGKMGKINYRMLAGAEWKMDANYGTGKTYDPEHPPSTTDGGIAARPRSYKDIPAMHQSSVYAEGNFFTKVQGRRINLQAGLRVDRISVVGTAWSPRTNLTYDVNDRLSIHAGYGIAAKAPTLLYLYPQKAYFDMKNLDWYAEAEAERLLIATTKVYNTENKDLTIARNVKQEAGFEWKLAEGKTLIVTGYHEKTKNGYSFNTTLNSVKITSLQTYEGTRNPGTTPTVTEGEVKQIVTDYLVPTNDRLNTNQGIEFDVNLGRVDALRTSFVLNGAWMNSRSISTNYYIVKLGGTSLTGPDKVAIFAPGRGKENERFNTSLRIIHNIPEARFVISLLAQTIWVNKNKYLHYQKIPVGYMERTTGDVVWLSEEERAQITSADTELYLSISDEYYVTESWRPSWLFNLRLTKEIGQHMGFSFFANNVFMSRALEESNRWSGSYSYRNESIFFGMELDIKI